MVDEGRFVISDQYALWTAVSGLYLLQCGVSGKTTEPLGGLSSSLQLWVVCVVPN